ncbi:FAD-binding oxidoreductase [Paroceanicella profunda]|uniref:FAD-binding oxidoreductase n=1 Tax=Paroceanicella profunda TaxID=2579971 RepID=A0A5B8FVF1_9RHOB|nr:FAD-dependent oxidoreductase [Paroceanicella profunda]QDL90459.1 FAD-binding oxidoreductase [Paroceanicella profunda]
MEDVVIVGAGVFGLWTAVAALARGRDVLLLERAGPGAGASGGVIGALAPHVPERWNAKKQFQFEALLALGPSLAALEAEAGGSAGYGRIGRLQPLLTPEARAIATRRAGAAVSQWGARARMEILPPDAWPGWMDPAAAPEGMVFDTLTARLDPAATCALLARVVAARGGRLARAEVRGIAPGRVETAEGVIAARRIVVAAGVESFALMAPLLGRLTGQAVKGQALVLDGPAPRSPLLYGDGTYVLPHATGGIAIGATSERVFEVPLGTDALLEATLARARRLCPAIRDLPVRARWAGLRPRALGRDPMLGPLPGAETVLAATGGFKISFGIGQAVGAAVAAMLDGEPPALPKGFAVAAHLAAD